MLTVGIDTGGTFTDVFVTRDDGDPVTVKVETTPHDLTVCFADAVRAAAEALELPLEEFLRRAEVIRFSSTIGTNTVLTRTGARVGLIVSEGAEEALYGAAAGGAIHEFVAPQLVASVREAVQPDGQVLQAPERDDVSRTVRGLLERGARLLVVSLANASANAANEQAVRTIVDESYPRHYLGAVPVLLSTEISASSDDAGRTTSAVVNAYMHQKLASSLYRAEDDLRRSGFRRPLLIVNADGGVTRVAKTRALDTYQSGPAAGIHAGALLCTELGIAHAVTADVGGTSTDVGLLIDASPVPRDSVDVGGLAILQPSVELLSYAVGGGSVATVQDGTLSVGPESAGAVPGPACFGLGGRQPTPTDAWLVLGYLTPDYYLGGRKTLDLALARSALEGIGQALGLSVEEAALALKDAAERAAAAGIEEMLDRASGLLAGTPRSELALVAYGGGGGLLLPDVARALGIGRTLISRYSPVFSAFGVSTFDVRHRYEVRASLDGAGVEPIVRPLVDAARRDMRGEGFGASEMELAVSVAGLDGRRLARTLSLEQVAALDLPRHVPLVFELHAGCAVAKPELPHEPGGGGAEPKLQREIVLPSRPRTVPVYARETIAAGTVLAGPVLVEAPDTTYLVPEGCTCRFHPSGTAVISEAA